MFLKLKNLIANLFAHQITTIRFETPRNKPAEQKITQKPKTISDPKVYAPKYIQTHNVIKPQVANEAEKTVRELLQTAEQKGYNNGWVYHVCRAKGLLKILEKVEKESSKITRKQLLTIELVPSSCWFTNVRSEISDSHWKKLAKRTAEKANFECEVCGGKGRKWPVECHELWHYNETNFRQTLTGLVALCPPCHAVKHIGFSSIKGRYDNAFNHLARVNGWSTDITKAYIEEQFQVWLERSKYEWTLDIKWLENELGVSLFSKKMKSAGG
jgi:hypothetical protein